MKQDKIPINKGNYSMDTPERDARFERLKGEGWEAGYKAYRQEWVRLPKELEVSEYPLLVDLELSSACNLRCPMCYTISDEFKKMVNVTLMDWRLFTKVIDEIGGKVPAIRLSLRGEATLHKRFLDCIKYAKSKGIGEVSTLTNGSKLNLPYFKQLVDAGLDWITLSVDGIGTTYEKIRAPIKFDDLLAHLKAIKEYKVSSGVNKPVIKVQGIWPAIRENPQAYYDTLAPFCDQVAFNPLIDYRTRDKDIRHLDAFTCPQHYQRIVVGADGRVMMCSNDEEEKEVIGNANDHSIYDLWHSEKLNSIRTKHREDQGFKDIDVCRRCYLPRMTEHNETVLINGTELIIENYINRKQVIGE